MRVFQVGLAIGLAILLPLLAQMVVYEIVKPPDYSADYEYYPKQPKTEAERQKANAEERTEQKKREEAQAAFNLKDFYVTFPLGIIEILVAFALRRRLTLGIGMFFGGLGTATCGAFTAWETLPSMLRLACLAFVLILLGCLALWLDHQFDAQKRQAEPRPG